MALWHWHRGTVALAVTTEHLNRVLGSRSFLSEGPEFKPQLGICFTD
jgi:hypothetical protein